LGLLGKEERLAFGKWFWTFWAGFVRKRKSFLLCWVAIRAGVRTEVGTGSKTC
jgi:hypothetical protein